MKFFAMHPVRAFALAATLIGLAAAAEAGERCEKKCFKAETCPIVGSKCLQFDWCREECAPEESTKPEANGAAPPAGPLPPATKAPLPGPGSDI